jgi:hypothetical protein
MKPGNEDGGDPVLKVEKEGAPGADDGAIVPDPTASLKEEENKAKGDTNSAAVDDDVDNADGDDDDDDDEDPNDDDGREDSMFEETIAEKADEAAVSGSSNKLRKELDDEAPKTFPQTVSHLLFCFRKKYHGML